MRIRGLESHLSTHETLRRVAIAGLAFVMACGTSGGGGSPNGPDGSSDGPTHADAGVHGDSTAPDGDSSEDATSDSGPGTEAGKHDGATGSCLGSSFLSALGKDRLVIGLTGSSAAAAAAPYDIQYIYLSGGLPTTPCTACGSSCNAPWWGCYNTPPGAYATDFIASAKAETPAQVPMFTYYEILQTAVARISGFVEGPAEATVAATNVGLMTSYYDDWRFLLQEIGSTQAILHIEPDFWGYVRQAGDPTTLPAAVGSANPTDCSSLPATIAGMGQCMISMTRKYAPHALVGLQASAWNIAGNTETSLDVTVDAKEVAAVLSACGQSTADFVVVETSDRDAGYYQFVKTMDQWWDPTDAMLPDYAQDLAWIKALTEALGVPALYWQTPLGNAAQNNTTNHYQDNRVDYFFGGSAAQVESGAPVTVPSHWSDLAAAHVVGVAFGAGAGGCTTPDTDGGHLAALTKTYVTSGGQALCP
jgi:hypothetical protein